MWHSRAFSLHYSNIGGGKVVPLLALSALFNYAPVKLWTYGVPPPKHRIASAFPDLLGKPINGGDVWFRSTPRRTSFTDSVLEPLAFHLQFI